MRQVKMKVAPFKEKVTRKLILNWKREWKSYLSAMNIVKELS
jgi:hypothetical protein